MKRRLIMIIALSVFLLTSVTASARDRHRDDNDDNRNHHRVHHSDNRDNHNNHNNHNNHRYNDNRNWHSTHRNDYEADRHLPFKWHDHHSFIRERHHMERIYDSGWDDRFPGTVAYRWYNNGGFWHHGRYVTDAVFFFNSDDRLVSIGYMHDGVFIHFREDREVYESRDSFFISWWRH